MAMPDACITVDMVTKTPQSRRRNRFYYQGAEGVPGPSSVASMVAFANSFMEVMGSKAAELMGSHAQIEKCEARYWHSSAAEWEGVSTSAAIIGDISNEDSSIGESLLPDEVSLIVQVRTGKTGRSNRGRRFFTGLSELVQNNGIIVATEYKDAAKDLANLIPMDLEVEEWEENTHVFNARHYARKTNQLHPITACYALSTLGTRLDRRQPLALERIP